MDRKIFVNLPIQDLARTQAFWHALGFSFDAAFSNDKGACLVIARDRAYAMLLVRPFFQSFTPKPVADGHASTQVLVALSCASREEVDTLVRQAVAAGGRIPRPPEDHGFMYGHAFEDPDGHIWEPFWMNPDAVPPAA